MLRAADFNKKNFEWVFQCIIVTSLNEIRINLNTIMIEKVSPELGYLFKSLESFRTEQIPPLYRRS